ncbi:MAG: hypothetical protein ACHP7E_02660 [Burkholderiales bacterium]
MRACRLLRTIAPAVMLAAAAARAEAPAPSSPPGPDLRGLCETVSMNPADGKELARRSECVLSGVLPSTDRIAEARMLAKAALAAGEPSGGLMLYLVFQADPSNQFVRGGQADPQAYRRLAARSLQQRQEQVEAIEGLGFAAGRNHAAAGVLLASYFHDTVAPRNVQRTGAMTALLLRNGERTPLVERFAHEADAIVRVDPGTQASVRGFMETYRQAVDVVRSAYASQAGAGRTCAAPQLTSVSAGEIQGAQYLPLQGNMVRDSYLVQGDWTESWTFQACGQEIPVKVGFAADGWGGTTSSVHINQGD